MDQLWLPDIFIYNLHSIKKHKFIYDFDGIFLGNDTEIDYEITFEVRIYCPMEFESYPLGCVHLLILNTRKYGTISRKKPKFSPNRY